MSIKSNKRNKSTNAVKKKTINKKKEIVINVIDDLLHENTTEDEQQNKIIEEEIAKLKQQLESLEQKYKKISKPKKDKKILNNIEITEERLDLVIENNLENNTDIVDNLPINTDVKIKLKADNSKTILSRNGVRMNKLMFTADILNDVKKELTVKPFIYEDDTSEAYPVYRETPTELIIPKYYSLNKFGPIEKNTLTEEKINMLFTGDMRDFQIEIVNKCLNHLKVNYGGILTVPCGRGKCLAKGTKIIMFDGTIKCIEDVKIGEYLMGDDSMPRKILNLGHGFEEMFDIIQLVNDENIKKQKYTVNRSHILSLKNSHDIIIDISINDYLNLPDHEKILLNGYRVPIDFPETFVDLNPQILDTLIIQNIPPRYKFNSQNVRLCVLKKILNHVEPINNYYTLVGDTSSEIMKDIIYLCRSLGYVCTDYYVFLVITVESLLYKINVKSVGVGEYYGIEIDGNRRYLIDDFTVTHNTVMAIKLAAELGLKTLVIVHKTFLLDQWIERITQFTNARIGLIKQNKIKVKDCDIIVGMIQSISMKDYDPRIFNDIGCVIYDECFAYKEKVITDKGNIPIGKLYKMFYNKENLPLIKSYNETLDTFEFKKMTFAWKKNNNNIIDIQIRKKNISCTTNHKFLTSTGYKEAQYLTINDMLLGISDNDLCQHIYMKKLNDDQEQIIIGSFLGNGIIDTVSHKRYRLTKRHDVQQYEYCKWKASMFDVYVYELNKIKNTCYSDTHFVEFQTKCFDSLHIFTKKKQTCPQSIIDKLDFRGISIWYMDNGFHLANTIQTKFEPGEKINVTILTCLFDENTHERLVKKLNDLGIESIYFKEIDGNYYVLLNENGTRTLLSNIYKYIHSSMYYKINIPFIFNSTNIYTWNNKFMNVYTSHISKISRINKMLDVYDIEVEDNHNFIIANYDNNQSGLIVHNCHHTASKVFSNSLYKTCAKYTIGLSATPKRADGLEKVTNWYLGDSMYSEIMRINKQVVTKIIYYKSNNALFREKKAWMKGRGMTPSTTKMLNNLCLLKERTMHIANIVNELRKDPERKMLILSERKAHLIEMKKAVDESIAEDIKADLVDENEIKTYMYTGDSKRADRKNAEMFGDILFATFQLAHEGLDIERLNTIILATPKKNIIQSVGRIMRKILKEGDIRPLIIDFSDVLSVYKNQSNIREQSYKKSKYKTEHYYVKNNKIITFDDYMKQEENLTQEEIMILPNRIVYDTTWESILDVTRVIDNPDDLIQLQKGIDIDGDSDCDIENLDDIDNDDENKKPKFNKIQNISTNGNNTNHTYMF